MLHYTPSYNVNPKATIYIHKQHAKDTNDKSNDNNVDDSKNNVDKSKNNVDKTNKDSNN